MLRSTSIGWRRRTISGSTASDRSRWATRSLSATTSADLPVELRRQLEVEGLAVGDEELRELRPAGGELVRGPGVLRERGVELARRGEVVDDLDPAPARRRAPAPARGV